MSQQVTLKRSLSLPMLTFYGLGTILGAGIYVLIGEVAAKAGMFTPVAFLLAAIIAGFTAFSYAELSARYPRSAGEAAYVLAAFRWRWLAAACGWSVVLVGIVSSATIANGFVGYLQLFIQAPPWLVITLLVLSLGMLAAWGISQSVIVAMLMTLLEIAGLLLVLFVAGDSLETLPQRWRELVPPLTLAPWSGILLAAFLAFYAFIGFEDMVNVAEEVKDPSRTLPRAILLALGVSTLFYVLIALVAVLALPLATLAHSSAPLAAIVEAKSPASHYIIGLISLVAVVNGALIQIIMAARVLYGMGRQHMAPAWFARVHPATRTPLGGTLVVTSVILALALGLPLVTLAQITSFITLMIFALVNLSLLRLKLRGPALTDIVSYPLWVPLIGGILCLAFLFVQGGWGN